MATTSTANLGAGLEILRTNSFSGNHSSSLGQKSSTIVSDVLLYQRVSARVSNLQASQSSTSSSSSSSSWSSRVIRSETKSCDGAELDQNAALVSRRWATIALPVGFATLSSSIVLSNGVAMAEDVGIETKYGENGAKARKDFAIVVGDVENGTLKGCGLGVARYPDFVYNAEGGGGTGKAEQLAVGRTSMHFDAEGLYIPAVCFDTTTILGLPLPPGLKIEVVPKTVEGKRVLARARQLWLGTLNR
ncbi:unnamed protein product [Calypogeia fissa]